VSNQNTCKEEVREREEIRYISVYKRVLTVQRILGRLLLRHIYLTGYEKSGKRKNECFCRPGGLHIFSVCSFRVAFY
jgi:hypothetical protein